VLRIVAGDPLIMKKMVKHFSYADRMLLVSDGQADELKDPWRSLYRSSLIDW
jgi:hypothetical protein